jgi:hypothetical protein
VHKSLLNVILHDQLTGENAEIAAPAGKKTGKQRRRPLKIESA